MNAKPKSETPPAPIFIGLPKMGRGGRWLLVTGLIVILTGGASYAVWQQVRGHVLASDAYQIDPLRIAITPLPRWIHADIRSEVLRDASFTGPLSLLDDALTVRMASVFAAHPWVAHVERVSKKYPSGLEVVLRYRQPVAMVELSDGALPVDAQGVVLPTRDFSPADAERYPRIGGINSTPSGPVGTRWGDACVAGAAQIAGALLEDWHKLHLFRVVPVGPKPARTGVEYAYALTTHGGSKIFWGRAPSTNLPGEIAVAEKLAQLRRYAEDHGGTLDGLGGPQQLKFSDTGDLVPLAGAPIRPLPKTDEQ